MSDDNILEIPEPHAPRASNSQTSGRIISVIEGGLFALFTGLLIQALALFGFITIKSAHVFMFFTWVVGTIIIHTKIIPGRSTKHKYIWIIVFSIIWLCADLIMAKYAPQEQGKVTTLVAPTATPPPIVVPTTSPTPQASPQPTSTIPVPSPSSSAAKPRRKQSMTNEFQGTANSTINSSRIASYLEQAKALEGQEKFTEALALCQKVLSLDPNNAAARQRINSIMKSREINQSKGK